MMKIKCMSLVVLWAGTVASLSQGLSRPQQEFFESRIRPVLSQECYECHNSHGKAKGGLILDHRAALLAGGDGGPGLVVGKPEESLLIQAIRHDDPDLTMPEDGARLDDSIIQDFIEWIQMGAPDPRDSAPVAGEIDSSKDWEAVFERRKAWWSFQPIGRPSPPESDWSDHPVDRFIDAARREVGLEPAEQAEASVLVRRMYFALIGLPPTPQQLDNFLAAYESDRTAATEALADELLADPGFGERWARHWMDWIRYAESHGSEGDPAIQNAYLYRDYLIRALNEDVPYDQLVREHIAGDLMEAPRINKALGINESLIGTAHWRMVFHGFAPTDALDEKVRFIDDQINVFSKAFMGLTVSCARCHNHKFDAISQEDYYALFGVLASARPGRRAVDLPERLEAHRADLQSMKSGIRKAVVSDWSTAMEDLKVKLLDPNGPAKNADKKSSWLHPFHQSFSKGEQGSEFVDAWSGLYREWVEKETSWQNHLGREYSRRWDLSQSSQFSEWYTEGMGLTDPVVPAGAFAVAVDGDQVLLGIYPSGAYSHLLSTKEGGRLTSPDFNLDKEYDLWLRVAGGGRSMARYVVHDYPRNGTVYPVNELRNEKDSQWHWRRYNVDYWTGDDIHIEVTTGNDAPLLVKNSPRSWFGIREAVLMKKDGARPPSEPSEHLGAILEVAKEQEIGTSEELATLYQKAIALAVKAWGDGSPTDSQALLLDASVRSGLLPNKLDQLAITKPLVERYRSIEDKMLVATRVPTLAEWKPKNQALFDRGNHKKPLHDVPRRFLEAFDTTPYGPETGGRPELAEDVLRPGNPLSRRVIVNRIWHHLFGVGLVATPDNFGRLGAKVSHPELLDYLANRFVEDEQWSLKRLIRLLVTSKSWGMASESNDLALSVDPGNKFLSHFNLRRLEAEPIRDSLLQVAGSMNRKSFGSPVGGDSNRRSVYVGVIRNRLDPFLTTFDAPIPFATQGRRNITTVPGQSLTMMNGKFVVDEARNWSRRLAARAESESTGQVLESMWRTAFSRVPSNEELKTANGFVETQLQAYRQYERKLKVLRTEFEASEEALDKLRESAESKVRKGREGDVKSNQGSFLAPVAEWLFDADGRDSLGTLDCVLLGDARIEDGALVVDGGEAFARSNSLKKDLSEKTIEVWVQLDDLDQRGGGVISVQSSDGSVFDAIVIGEQEARHWIAGSDSFRRTQSFDGPEEKQAASQPIHFCISYSEDGTITAFRNGKLYGKPYKRGEMRVFKAGQSEVVFGLRHGNPGGGRMLLGKILEARLYDRALTAEEASEAARGNGDFVSERDLIGALSPLQQADWHRLNSDVPLLKKELYDLRAIAPSGDPSEIWFDLALAVFNSKEFIYIR